MNVVAYRFAPTHIFLPSFINFRLLTPSKALGKCHDG